jgi:predicted AlkP superfamily phosphohydrolase/phosphomutase
MPEHPAQAAYAEFIKTPDYAKAHGYTNDQSMFPRILFTAGWNAALKWMPITVGKIRKLCGLPGGEEMSGFVTSEDLTAYEKRKLEDEARVNEWVEGLDATHLYEALLERLQERPGLILEESEISALLREVCSRLSMLEEVEKEIGDINKIIDRANIIQACTSNTGDDAVEMTPVKTPA